MGSNTTEYRALQSLTNELRLAVKQDITGLGGALFADRFITQDACDDLRNSAHSKEERAARLVGIIQDKVRENPCNYHTFISVLKKWDQAQYENILHQLQDTYNQGAHPQLHRSRSGSSTGGSFDLEQPLDYQQQRSRLSSNASRASFEHAVSLDESAIENECDEDTQSYMMKKYLDDIKDHFAVLLGRLRDAFEGFGVDKVHQYLIDKLQCDIPQPSDMQSFFNYLSSRKFWNYQHYSLVETLDKHFLQQCDKSIQQHILEYKSQLCGYLVARKIIRSEFFIDSTSSESTRHSVAEYTHEHHRVLKMRLKLMRNISEESLQYIADLWESLAVELELPSLTAVIDSIIQKCIEITWLILPCDAEKITPAIAAKHLDFFKKNGITLLTVDGVIIYEKEAPVDQVTQQLDIHDKALSAESRSLELKQMERTQVQESLSATNGSPQSEKHTLQGEVQQPAEDVPDPCIYYSLFGECKYGARCRHQHISPTSSRVTVYIEAKALKYPLTQYFEYKERNPTSHKGFIILQSEREPTKEIKVVAEDDETAEYAQERLRAIKPGKKKNMKRQCVDKRLFGKCRNKSCTFVHGGVRKTPERPKIDYFCNPMGLWSSLRSVIGLKEYSDDDEAYKVVQSDKNPNREVKIIAESEEALEYAKRRLTVIVGRKYAERYITYCYVHPEDLKELNCSLRFHKQPKREQEYIIVKAQSNESTILWDRDYLASLCRSDRSPKSISELLDDPLSIPKQFSLQMRFTYDLSDAIHDKLQCALEWTSKENLQLKLRGRFGKLTFTKSDTKLCDVEGCDAMDLIKYLFENARYKCFFNTRLSEGASLDLVSSLSDTGSVTEFYELKLGIRNTDRLEVHLRFPEGRSEPELIQLKKDDSRILTIDIMCLNHEHDLRLDLSTFKIISPFDEVVHDFLSKVAMTAQHTISFVPVGPDREWAVTVLRHKIVRAYYLHDARTKNCLITVTFVREYKTKERDLKPSDPIEVNINNIKEEIEIEFHNLNLDVQVGNHFGQSPVKSLALLMEPDKIPAELKSLTVSDECMHSTEKIMKEFAGKQFIQTMHILNK